MTCVDEARCGACRGAWGRCACASLLPAPSELARWAVLFGLLTRSGTEPKAAARTASAMLRSAT